MEFVLLSESYPILNTLTKKIIEIKYTLKKCWVLTQFWVKYGQTQTLG